MEATTPPKTLSFSHQAAKFSWVCPVFIFLIAAIGGHAGSRLYLELVALMLMVTGLASGVIALFGMRKHGRTGILAPAIVGIVINALLLFIFVTNFFAARAKALQERGEVSHQAKRSLSAIDHVKGYV